MLSFYDKIRLVKYQIEIEGRREEKNQREILGIDRK